MSGPTSHALGAAERARIEEVDRLAALGEASVPELVRRLDDPSWIVRRSVVGSLATLGDAAVAPLAEVLRTRRDDERRLAAAVDALAASTGATAHDAAVGLTRESDPALVVEGAQILGRRRDPAAVGVLRALVAHPDDNVAVTAIEGLGRVGGRASVDALVEAVRSENFFRVFPAIDVLGRSGDPRAVQPLAELLAFPHFASEAARALGRTGDPAAAPVLLDLMAEAPEVMVRSGVSAFSELLARHAERHGSARAVEAAAAAHPAPEAVVNALENVLPSLSEDEQVAVCRTLGALGSELAVPVLLSRLDGTAPVANAAAAALRAIGQDTEAEILAAIRRGTSERRLALLPVVHRADAAPAVAEALRDPDPEVQVAACDTLARLGQPSVVPALFDLLGSRDPRVTQAAVAAIQSLASPETERLAIEAARSGEQGRRRAALMILSYFGFPEGLEVFLDALDDADRRVRDTALQGLAFLEEPRAQERLYAAARGADPGLRAGAVRALRHAPDQPRVYSVLLRALTDGDPWVRYYACQSLGRMGAEQVSPTVAGLLDDPAGQVRVAAVEALSHLRGPAALEALRRAAAMEDPEVRRAALIGLGVTRQAEGLDLLLAAAEDQEPATRLVAVSALAAFPGPEVVDALARAAEDSDENVRDAAIAHLSARPAEAAVRALAGLLRDPARRERAVAALALPVPGRVGTLARVLENADDETAPHVLAALARIQRPGATAAILSALSSPNPAVRRAAAPSVAALGTEPARAALAAAAASDPDPEVRRVCALLLAR